jgi:hypothetical protein
MHLTEVDFVDLAEGTRAESSAPHLASCERCRQQLLEMRRLMAAASAVEVPEPSPLFWDHLSHRVSEAVAAERDMPRRWWHDATPLRRLLIPASVVAVAAILIVSVLTRVPAPQTPVAGGASGQPVAATAPDAVLSDGFDDAADDESLMLVADLSAALSADAATDTDAEPAPRGSAEHAVTHLNDDELRELQQLLKQELASSGA